MKKRFLIALLYLLVPVGIAFADIVDAVPGVDAVVEASHRYFVDSTEADQGVATATGDKTIKDHVDAIGTTKKATIYCLHDFYADTTSYTVTTNVTITSNITLEIENGALIAGAGTLTIQGQFKAGLHKVFGSSITVVFAGGVCEKYHPEWFDDDIDALVDSLTSGGLVWLNRKIYTITSGITCTNHYVTFDGQSDATIHLNDATGLLTHLTFGNGTDKLYGNNVRNITFTRAQAATAGSAIYYNFCSCFRVEFCRIYGGASRYIYNGITVKECFYAEIVENHIDYMNNCGIYAYGTNATDKRCDPIITDNYIEECNNAAILGTDYVVPFIRNNWIFGNVDGIVLNPTNSSYAQCCIKIMENDIDGNSSYGIYIVGGNAYQISNNWLVGNAGSTQLNLAGSNGTFQIVGNYFDGGSASDGVHTGGGTPPVNVSFIGNQFSNCINGMYLAGDVYNISSNVYYLNTTAINLTSNPTNGMINSNLFDGNTTDINKGSVSTWIIRDNKTDNLTATASGGIPTFGETFIDSNLGALTLTLGSGSHVGDTVIIVMTDSSNSSTLSITNHETSDPEVATFDAVDETGVFMWTGTEWATIKATCTF